MCHSQIGGHRWIGSYLYLRATYLTLRRSCTSSGALYELPGCLLDRAYVLSLVSMSSWLRLAICSPLCLVNRPDAAPDAKQVHVEASLLLLIAHRAAHSRATAVAAVASTTDGRVPIPVFVGFGSKEKCIQVLNNPMAERCWRRASFQIPLQ